MVRLRTWLAGPGEPGFAGLRPCYAGQFLALCAKIGGPDRTQTGYLFVANEALYQMSYWPMLVGVFYVRDGPNGVNNKTTENAEARKMAGILQLLLF